MRKTLTLALLALIAITANAQHFDWVKTYTGPDISNMTTNKIVGNKVVGSMTDRDGKQHTVRLLKQSDIFSR